MRAAGDSFAADDAIAFNLQSQPDPDAGHWQDKAHGTQNPIIPT
jgi:hypothetical protein